MKKETILLVHNYYQIPGGEDIVVNNEKKLLEEHGHEVILYTRNNSELKNMSLMQKIMVPFDTIFSLKTYTDVKKLIKKHKINIVHVHNTLNLISPSVFYAAYSCNIPVVNTLHNFRMQCPAGTFFRNHRVCEVCVSKGLGCAIKHKCYRSSRIQTLASAFTLWIHRVLGTYKKVNYICLTEFNRDKLIHFNNKYKVIDPNKIFIKTNFTYDSAGKIDQGSNVGANNSKEYYLFVGRIEEIKGIRLLVRAFAQSGKRLALLGDGEDYARVERYIEKNKLSNIELLGRVGHDAVCEWMRGAKAVIAPSICYETFGMIAIEAYANHSIVVAPKLGNVGALIRDGKTGFRYENSTVKDINHVIEVIDRLSIAELETMRNAAYSEYVEKYSAEKNYEALKVIYRQIMN